MSITDRLRDLKARSGLTEAELARLAGIPFGTLHGYILGRRKVSAENLLKLAKVFRVKAETLIGGSGK